MTDPQTPAPTPAVERAAVAWSAAYQKAVREAPSNRLGISRTDAKKAYEMAVRAALAAALDAECHEAVVQEDGEEQPCNAYAVAYREDVVGDAVLGVYPVCEEHARPPLVPLTIAILGGVAA